MTHSKSPARASLCFAVRDLYGAGFLAQHPKTAKKKIKKIGDLDNNVDRACPKREKNGSLLRGVPINRDCRQVCKVSPSRCRGRSGRCLSVDWVWRAGGGGGSP